MVCDKCNRLCKSAKTICMQGKGSKDSNIMFVGDFPRFKDDENGIPFSENISTYLNNKVFKPVGIDPDNLYMTNAIKCTLPPKKNKATVQEMRNCRQFLFDEIKEINPKVIVAAGNVALFSLLYLDEVKDEEKDNKESGMAGIGKWQGKMVWHKDFNCYVMPVYSPSYIFTESWDKHMYPTRLTIKNLQTALQVSRQEEPLKKYPSTYWINNRTDAIDVLKMFYEYDRFALDTEAESFHWMDAEFYGMSLCNNKDEGFYIDFQRLDINDLDIRDCVSRLLGNNATKIFHNAPFDKKLLMKQGFDIKGEYYDTMIRAHLIDENFYKGLKPNTWRYLDFGGYDFILDEYRRENKLTKSFKGIPSEVLAPYAAYDAIATFQLYDVFENKIKNEGFETLEKNIILPARRVFTGIEYRGIRVDKEKTKVVNSLMVKAEKNLLKKIKGLAGQSFNPGSSLQKQKLFFDKLKMEPLKQTKTSLEKKLNPPTYSTDGDSLRFFKRQGGLGGDIAEILIDYSYLTKQHSTFVSAILTNAVLENDLWLMHTSYNLAGTVTFRVSCSNPCLHNIPNDGMIKGLYIPRPNRKFLHADIKAAEMRVLGVLSHEPRLLRAFNEGRDIHVEVWRMMFNMPESAVPTKLEKRIAKIIGFGLVYGMGPYRLALILEITKDEAVDYVNKFFRAFPNIKTFFEMTYRMLDRDGYVRTLFNSKRRLPNVFDKDYSKASKGVVARVRRQAGNTLVQTPAALFTLVGLNRVESYINKNNLLAETVHSIHDCGIWDTPENEIPIMTNVIKKAFEKQISILPVRMEVDVHEFNNWGEDCDESKLAKIIESLDMNLNYEEKALVGRWL